MDTHTLLLIAIAVMIIAIIVSVCALLYYAGAFAGVDLRAGEPPLGVVTIVYKYCRDYVVNVDETFRDLIELCPKRKLVTLYYDNPADFKMHPEAKIRYCIGCVLHEDTQATTSRSDDAAAKVAAQGSSTAEDDELRRKLLEKGFKEKQIPKLKRALFGIYPFTCSASVSYAEKSALGAISQVAREKKLTLSPIVELCDPAEGKILYVTPLERNVDLLVAELDTDPLPPPAITISDQDQDKKND